MTTTRAKTATTAQVWRDRVEAADWGAVRAELDAYGCALTGPLLIPPEAAAIAALYPDDSRFRSTANMGRHRFGEGEYRYFAEPFPDAVVALKQALYPETAADRPRVVDPAGPRHAVAGQSRRLAGHVPRRGADQVHPDPAQVQRR